MTNNFHSSKSLMWPVVKALQSLGGPRSILEMYKKIIELENIDNVTLQEKKEGSTKTVFSGKLTWTRTALKNEGYLKNVAWGIWELTEKGENAMKNDFK